MKLSDSLTLPCSQVLPNRLVKSAMSENMATRGHVPGAEYYELYRRWARGGVGMTISGNVMVDSRHLGEANNVVIENGRENLEALKRWNSAKEGTEMKLWIQLNHPGKQSPKFLNPRPLGPSAIALQPPLDQMFAKPAEASEAEILEIIERFAYASRVVKKTGFDGVQIHGAHGYLVSQFLSPVHNQRADRWGGSLENRMRLVVEIYRAIRAEVGPEFPVGLKLNSADFQKGGFTAEESLEVGKRLSELGLDLLEISGGSYEAPVMMKGEGQKASTQKREAYFLEYAEKIKKVASCPIMVTGGMRTQAFMESALTAGSLDLIGLARPVALNPDFPRELLAGKGTESLVRPLTTGFKKLDRLVPLEITWYTQQLHRMGKGRSPAPNASVLASVLKTIVHTGIDGLRRVRA